MDANTAAARQALAEIDQAVVQTRRAIAAGIAAPILMLWGVVWAGAFTATWFWPDRGGLVWLVADGLGTLGMVAIAWFRRREAAVRSESARQLGRRLFWFWILLFAYGFVWLRLLEPRSPGQIEAFIVVLVMFAYAVMGLWLDSGFLLGLGLAVTALTVLGYLLLPGVFDLWMAVGGGGALLASGLYMRWKWS